MALPEKKSLYAQEQDREDVQEEREIFEALMPELDVRTLKLLDEAGFKLNMVVEYAHSLKGERIKMPAPLHGENVSVIMERIKMLLKRSGSQLLKLPLI